MRINIDIHQTQLQGKDLKEGMAVCKLSGWKEGGITYGLVVKQCVSRMFNSCFNAHETLAIYIIELNEICIITKDELYNVLGTFSINEE